MKTIKLFFSTLLVVIISAIGMASCNDDDEPKDKVIEVTMSVSENTDIMYFLFDHNKENPIECMLVLSLLFLTRYVLWWHLAAVPC